MNIYQKIHGTTADRFRIGSKNQSITLVGETIGAVTLALNNRDDVALVSSSTLFFTVYVVGQGTTNTAAYEIKGCYISGTNTLSGYVVNTFVDTGSFIEPVVNFAANNEMTVNVNGLVDETINWTAVVEFIIV